MLVRCIEPFDCVLDKLTIYKIYKVLEVSTYLTMCWYQLKNDTGVTTTYISTQFKKVTFIDIWKEKQNVS